MKKSVVAFLITALLSTGLTACTSSASQEQPKTDTSKQTATAPTTPNLNNNNSSTSTPANTAAPNTGLETSDPSQEEVRKAFNLDTTMKLISPLSVMTIAEGKMQLPLDSKQSLALAKAISTGLGSVDWKQEDHPPGIFLDAEGKTFAIGYKRKSGEMLLHHYELQPDGEYKDVKQESKKA